MNSDRPTEKKDMEVFLGGISAHSTEGSIRTFAETEFGAVEHIEFPICPITKRSKGFARIKFKNIEVAQKALKKKHFLLDGLMVAIKRWVRQPYYETSKAEVFKRKIYVRFPKSTTEEMLRQYFSQFGAIELIDIKKDIGSLEQRCFCYITFETSEAALKATSSKPHMINSK